MTPRDLALPVWPKTLAPRVQELFNDAPTFYGPRPGFGAPQGVMSDSGLWRFPLTDLSLHGWRVLALRALLWRIQAEGCPVYMPLWDMIRAPVALGPGVTFSDDAPFSDGALFAGVAPFATVAAAAVASSTALTVTLPAGVTLSAGQIIGAGERAYGVRRIVDAADGATVLYLWPKLREALAIGDRIELAEPLVRMRLDARSLSQSLGALDRGIYGRVSLDFVEDDWS